MSLTVVSVALAIGAVWEIGEYTVDDIFHTNNQQYMKSLSLIHISCISIV